MAREILARIVEGTTESRVRLQAWSLARRVGIEPPSDDARRVRGVVVDVGFDAGTDTLAGYEDGTARYLNQAGGGIVWETADETIGASIEALIAGRSGGGRAEWPARRSAAARAAERWCLDLAPHRRRDPPWLGPVRGPCSRSDRWTGDRGGNRAHAAAHRAERDRAELTACARPSRGARRDGGSAPPGAQSVHTIATAAAPTARHGGPRDRDATRSFDLPAVHRRLLRRCRLGRDHRRREPGQRPGDRQGSGERRGGRRPGSQRRGAGVRDVEGDDAAGPQPDPPQGRRFARGAPRTRSAGSRARTRASRWAPRSTRS